jgi:hypothetical protein
MTERLDLADQRPPAGDLIEEPIGESAIRWGLEQWVRKNKEVNLAGKCGTLLPFRPKNVF